MLCFDIPNCVFQISKGLDSVDGYKFVRRESTAKGSCNCLQSIRGFHLSDNSRARVSRCAKALGDSVWLDSLVASVASFCGSHTSRCFRGIAEEQRYSDASMYSLEDKQK